MANKKKDPKDIKKRRCISLSDNEIREMKILTGKDSLTEAIREMQIIINRNWDHIKWVKSN